jgi:crotonobetainyl-CoA:carnitine CoA-transferase CaiB-like acyl-CoA transferase
MAGLLSGVKVIDLGQGISAPYCAKVLANMGASVIKVEPPNGDEARRMGPFPGNEPHPEKSGLFLALNANKYGVTLDISTSDGAEKFLELLKNSDIVIENFSEGYLEKQNLGYDDLLKSNPGIIVTSITPFGSWGPYRSYKATDLTQYHFSGNAHGLLGPVEDPENDPPIRAGGHQAETVAGLSAAAATLIALFKKRMTGEGSHVEVSGYEAMVTQLISGLANSAYGRLGPTRDLSKVKEAAIGGMVGAIGGVLQCNDGFVAISPREEEQWKRWLGVMGNPDWGQEERFLTRDGRQANSQALWELLNEWSQKYSKQDIARWGQDKRIPCFPVNTVEDLLEDEHLKQRQFFVEIDHPVAGKFKYPGVPYSFSNSPLPLAERPAPMLGEHNSLIPDDTEKP